MASGVYADYAFTYFVSITPLAPTEVEVYDATMVNQSMVSGAAPFNFSTRNASPGNRTLPIVTGAFALRVSAIYPADSIVCRNEKPSGSTCLRGTGTISPSDLGTSDGTSTGFALTGGAGSGEIFFGVSQDRKRSEVDVVHAVETSEVDAYVEQMAAPAGYALIVEQFGNNVLPFANTVCSFSSAAQVLAQTGDLPACG